MIIDGKREMSMIGRYIVYNSCKDILSEVDFNNDDIFLNPFLFSAMSRDIDTDYFLMLFFNELKKQDVVLKAKTDSSGAIYIPKIGTIKTRITNSPINIDFKKISITDENNIKINFLIEKDPQLLNGKFNIIRHKHWIFDPYIRDIAFNKKINDDIISLMEKSLSIINEIDNDYLDNIIESTRGFYIFEDKGTNSFAVEAIPGISFLSIPDTVSCPYFIEDIIHQCGHTIFNYMFFSEKNNLFTVEKNTPINYYTKNMKDKRTIYTLYHAVFTEYMIAKTLLSYINMNIYKELDDKKEAIGRLSFILMKYEIDIKNIFHINDTTKLGENIKKDFLDFFVTLKHKSKSFIKDINLSNQGYNFCYKTFMKMNNN